MIEDQPTLRWQSSSQMARKKGHCRPSVDFAFLQSLKCPLKKSLRALEQDRPGRAPNDDR